MARTETWFMAERATQLAIMYLTRREDVRVIRQQEGMSPDLLVFLLNSAGRSFGVVVGASASNQRVARQDGSVLIASSKINAQDFKDTPFPVCQFYFTMMDDRGYWKWIRQPSLDPSSGPGLTLNLNNELMPLTDQEMDNLISTVNGWYDRRGQPRHPASAGAKRA